MQLEDELFVRDPDNPILVPGDAWWEARGVLNPGVAVVDDRVAMVYRAVGSDGLSRLGLAWSADGRQFTERRFLHEAALDDHEGRLGVEDPRLIWLDDELWLVYTKASVGPVGAAPLSWEPAPFRVRMALARLTNQVEVVEERPLLPGVQAKDGVLFPRRIGGLYHALVRVYPSIQITTSPDLRSWSAPRTVLEPLPGGWEGERVGAGPAPIETPWGWLVIYHANAHYTAQGNRRHYRTGLAVLDLDDPSQVLYRHAEPIFVPKEPYETEGPVGMVVFATGVIEREGLYYLYYGAADGVIGLATAPVSTIHDFIERGLAKAG
ncbi:MAG TPA: glycosidase [Chloroflexota bacterium]|nr:glycosidase [Chloroflexota bacterium]